VVWLLRTAAASDGPEYLDIWEDILTSAKLTDSVSGQPQQPAQQPQQSSGGTSSSVGSTNPADYKPTGTPGIGRGWGCPSSWSGFSSASLQSFFAFFV